MMNEMSLTQYMIPPSKARTGRVMAFEEICTTTFKTRANIANMIVTMSNTINRESRTALPCEINTESPASANAINGYKMTILASLVCVRENIC